MTITMESMRDQLCARSRVFVVDRFPFFYSYIQYILIIIPLINGAYLSFWYNAPMYVCPPLPKSQLTTRKRKVKENSGRLTEGKYTRKVCRRKKGVIKHFGRSQRVPICLSFS